jgi:hypothetical protein
MRQDMLDYAADIVWLLIYSIIAVVFGATVMFVIVFFSEMESFSDYRIIYYDSKGDKTNIWLSGSDMVGWLLLVIGTAEENPQRQNRHTDLI